MIKLDSFFTIESTSLVKSVNVENVFNLSVV